MTLTTENIFRLRSPGDDAAVFILDESLQTKTAGLCDLLLSVEPGGVQLALKERKNNRFLALESFPADPGKEEEQGPELLEKVSKGSRLLRNFEFTKAIVGVCTPAYTLVPDALFRKGDENGYINFNFPSEKGLRVFSHPVQSLGLHTIYGIPQTLYQELHHLFEEPVIHHHSTALLETVSLLSRSQTGRQLFLHFHGKGLDVIATDGKKLVLMNSFQSSGIEDILYYVLFLCEQLDMNPDTVPVKLAGEIDMQSALYKLLYKYIRNLSLADRPGSAEYSYGFGELPPPYYYPLFSLSVCE